MCSSDLDDNAHFSVPVLTDHRVTRRLEFQASYTVDCDELSHPVTRTTLMSIIQHHYTQIDRICQRGK